MIQKVDSAYLVQVRKNLPTSAFRFFQVSNAAFRFYATFFFGGELDGVDGSTISCWHRNMNIGARNTLKVERV